MSQLSMPRSDFLRQASSEIRSLVPARSLIMSWSLPSTASTRALNSARVMSLGIMGGGLEGFELIKS